jgi:S1-C subfamily serine protease
VLTCQHVIDNAESIEVAIEDHVYPAKLVREDKYNDLALLKIFGTFPPLAFCSKRSAQMGQKEGVERGDNRIGQLRSIWR